jgi:hypothetical protein
MSVWAEAKSLHDMLMSPGAGEWCDAYAEALERRLRWYLGALESDTGPAPDEIMPKLAEDLLRLRQEFEPWARRREISPKVRATIFRRDGFQCVECAEPNVIELVIDHRVPVAMGGSNEPGNLRTLCRSCNSRKGARL